MSSITVTVEVCDACMAQGKGSPKRPVANFVQQDPADANTKTYGLCQKHLDGWESGWEDWALAGLSGAQPTDGKPVECQFCGTSHKTKAARKSHYSKFHQDRKSEWSTRRVAQNTGGTVSPIQSADVAP